MQDKYHGKTVSHDVFLPLAKASNKTTIKKLNGQIKFAPSLISLEYKFNGNGDF